MERGCLWRNPRRVTSSLRSTSGTCYWASRVYFFYIYILWLHLNGTVTLKICLLCLIDIDCSTCIQARSLSPCAQSIKWRCCCVIAACLLMFRSFSRPWLIVSLFHLIRCVDSSSMDPRCFLCSATGWVCLAWLFSLHNIYILQSIYNHRDLLNLFLSAIFPVQNFSEHSACNSTWKRKIMTIFRWLTW